MAAPSWIRRLSEPADTGGLSFQIPQASLYSSTSSLASQTSLSKYSNISMENVADSRRSIDQDTTSIKRNTPEKYASKTVGRRINGNNQSRLGVTNKGYISGSSTLTSNPYSTGTLDLESEISSRYSSPRDSSGTSNKYMYQKRRNKSFDETASESTKHGPGITRQDRKREESWSYVDSEGYAQLPPSIHTSVSCTDFDGSSVSSSYYNQRGRKSSSEPPGTLDRTEENKRRKRRDKSHEDTRTSSGYNSYSELSEFGNTSKCSDDRHGKNRGRDSSSDNERNDRYSKYPRKTSKVIEDKIPEVSHKRCDSKLSVAESDLSGSSKDKKRTNDKGSAANVEQKSHKVPAIGNVSVTVTNNIQYDPNDPFSFIQPIDLPFHKKVRKCLGPVMAVLLLIILAAALGAAIYFASALKETQEKQIDMLRANLAMKIRTIDHIENIEELSSNDFEDLSSEYCKHMDIFYSKSKFGKTYRGCEVVSIKNSYINFTLFFMEEDATSSQIVEVIETSATTVSNTSSQLAVVDKFALELDTVKVKIDRKLEPETFNRMIVDTPKTTEQPLKTTRGSSSDGSKKKTTVRTKLLTTKPTPKPAQRKPIRKKKPPADKPVYSWNPCESYEGTYFPHPTHCNMFFQCTNGQTIEQKCTEGLLYHWKQLTCVSRFTRDVVCPDPSKAPPRPTTTTSTRSTIITSTSTTPAVVTVASTIYWFMETTSELPVPTKRVLPEGVVLTAIAGRYAERPKYSSNPCENKMDVQLYPHPDDCAMFIQCVNGQVRHMHCAKSLVFEPSNSACIFPTENELLCPDIKPCKEKNDGYFPHPYNCSKFIQCQNKKEKVMECQKDLYWSSKVNSCVHITPEIVCPLKMDQIP